MGNATRKVPHDTLEPYSKDTVAAARRRRVLLRAQWSRPGSSRTPTVTDELVREWIADRVVDDVAARDQVLEHG